MRRNNRGHKHDHSSLIILPSLFSSPDDGDNYKDDDIIRDEPSVGIDLSMDSRLYKVRLSRATGIEYVEPLTSPNWFDVLIFLIVLYQSHINLPLYFFTLTIYLASILVGVPI
jgi:hypothetical protein